MEYFPLGEELSFELALIQASQAIDLTAMLALEQKDSKRMLHVAETWVKMADFLVALGEHQDRKESKRTGFGVGFQGGLQSIRTENEDEEDVRTESD